MPKLSVDGLDIHWEEHGSGEETVVFAHGLLMSRRMWDDQIAALRSGYRCIAYDHRGQGDSETPAGPMVDLETLYLDAVELIERLAGGECHFVGLSMGGFVGMRLAARRPDLLKSVTLMDTRAAGEPEENVGKYRAMNVMARVLGTGLLVDRLMPILFGDAFIEGAEHRAKRKFWREHLGSLDRSIYKAVNGIIYRPSVVSELPRISVPTLVLHGGEDRAIPLRVGRELAEAIDGARFEAIPESGHSASIENPEAVNEALAGFLG